MKVNLKLLLSTGHINKQECFNSETDFYSSFCVYNLNIQYSLLDDAIEQFLLDKRSVVLVVK